MAGGGESYWNNGSCDLQVDHQSGILNNHLQTCSFNDNQDQHQCRILNNVSGIFINRDHDYRTRFNNGVRLVSTVSESSQDHQPPSTQIKLNPQQDGPLGLSLRRSESLLNLVQSSLTNEKLQKRPPQAKKYKAANFHGVIIKIGSWKWISRNPGDLVAKIYYSKKKLVWEFLFGALKRKMEISWSAISAINAFTNQGKNGLLELELSEPPQFGEEINCQKGKHTQWTSTTDFTENQARICRRHTLECLPGVIDKHFEHLMQRDERLLHLSRQPFPIHNSPFFPTSCLNFSHNHNDVGCSSSLPVANCRRQVFVSHVQNIIVPQTSPFVPHSSFSLPSSADLSLSISQEIQMTVAAWEQRRNFSSIPIVEQDSLLPFGPESWSQDQLQITNIENLNEFSNKQDGSRTNSIIKPYEPNYLNNSTTSSHEHMMISCNDNGFASKVHNPGITVEARMDGFGNDNCAMNHMAYLDNQILSLKDLELVNNELSFAGPSSWLPSQEVSIHDFEIGGNGMNQMGYSCNNMIRSFDPSARNEELEFEKNILEEQADQVHKTDQAS